MPRERRIDHITGGRSDARITAWTTPRVGVCTRSALLHVLGLSARQVDHRLHTGQLRPTRYHGVYVWGHAAYVRGQREAIALAACGPGAVLAGASSAWLRGQIGRYRGDVAVIVPAGRHGKLDGISRSRAVLLPDDVTTFGAMRVTTAERTVLDLPPEHLREGFQWLMRNGTPIEPLVARKAGGRGAVAFRHEASLLVPQLACTMSELEARFVLLCRRIGADLPLVNASLVDGELLDCTWPGRKLVVELGHPSRQARVGAGGGTRPASRRTAPATAAAPSRAGSRCASAGTTSSPTPTARAPSCSAG